MSARYHFEFVSRYRDQSDFKVYDRESKEWRRICLKDDMKAAFVGETIPADVLDAFNVWREAKHRADVSAVRERYGKDEADRVPPFQLATASQVFTILNRTEEFRDYVRSFYGPGGVYDMGATDNQIADATVIYLEKIAALDVPDFTWGDGDSVDRERVRDIMIEKFGLKFPEGARA